MSLDLDIEDDEEEWPDTWPTRDELRSRGFVRLSRPRSEIKSRPRVGQYYWVSFPCDAWKPEFFEKHPGIVIRAARKAQDDTCIIVPVTSTPPSSNPHAIPLSVNPNPVGQRDGVPVWAVCDHIYTVHLNRLQLVRDLHGSKGWRNLTPTDLEAVFAGVRKALHRVMENLDSPKSDTKAILDKASESPIGRPLGPNTLTLRSVSRRPES